MPTKNCAPSTSTSPVFKDYGRLSGVDLSKIRVGKTVDLDEYAKDNPRDFTLLKRAKLSELKKGLYYTTPWGQVHPTGIWSPPP